MKKSSFDYLAFLKTVPEMSGVYRMYDEAGNLLYVGKAKSLKKRLHSYFRLNNLAPRIRMLVSNIDRIDITITRNEVEALLLENTLIKKSRPKYNIVFRDDKSYPYITFSLPPAPRVSLFRGTTSKGTDSFGPFPHVTAAKSALNFIQKAFQLRTCEDATFHNRSRACLLHQIGRCSAPCIGLISPSDYIKTVEWAKSALKGSINELNKILMAQMQQHSDDLEFESAARIRDQIRNLAKVQINQYVVTDQRTDCDVIHATIVGSHSSIVVGMIRSGRHLGDTTVVPGIFTELLTEADVCGDFVKHHYAEHSAPRLVLTNIPIDAEIAADISLLANKMVEIRCPRNASERAWMDMCKNKNELNISEVLSKEDFSERAILEFGAALSLNSPPKKIECFDISHIQGDATVASCVVCRNGRMDKKLYRRFNVDLDVPGDDYAAMRHVIHRRFASIDEAGYPDVLVIDGGAGQMSSCFEVLDKLTGTKPMIVGVVKAPGRILGQERILVIREGKSVQLEIGKDAYRLLLAIRDEAHRFAITGHRTRRAATRKETALSTIVGVGPKRRRALLVRFGSIAGVQAATTDEIAAVQGIGDTMAKKIKDAL